MTTIQAREDLAKLAMLVAEEAGALVIGGYRSRPHADKKGFRDLVTKFDQASEAMIISRLASLAPGIRVVGEEGSGDESARDGLVFYVDPLDGTTNFVHGHPFWCISIGLLEDDQPIAGAVVAPALDLKWIGWAGDEGQEGLAMRNGRRCLVSSTDDLGEALIATGFPPDRGHAPANNFDTFMAVKRNAQAVRRCGAAAIDCCFVADGTYDAYWERRLHAWDVAAGAAIILGAKGRITALDGGPPDWHRGHVVASNGLVHRDLVDVIVASGL